MAFHGDFSSFALPDLLQWLDASRKTGTLQLVWPAGERRLFLLAGVVVASSGPGHWERLARLLELGGLANGGRVMGALRRQSSSGELEASARAALTAEGIDPELVFGLAREELIGAMADLTSAQEGSFHWTEDPDRSDEEWCVSDVGMRELLFESLRWLDELPEVERALGQDGVIVRAKLAPAASMPVLHRIILSMTQKGLPLGRLRLSLGLSRAATQRRVFDLLLSKKLELEGAPELHTDPVTELLEKGALLVRERQFDAAQMVFSSLLASDPSNRRVREFARMVDREHTASLYAQLPPIWVPELINDPELLSLLRPEERQVSALINGSWDVSTLVLASPARELETLKVLAKLQRMQLLRTSDAAARELRTRR